MKVETWFGTLEISPEGKVLESVLFSKAPLELAERSFTLSEEKTFLPPPGFDFRKASLECGFFESGAEYDSILHELTLRKAKLQVSKALSLDQRIIQAVEALDDINETTNTLSERLFEWYGNHFPETGLTGEALAGFVVKYGNRANVDPEDPFYEKASTSIGAELPMEDEVLIKAFAESLFSLYARRGQLEAYIRESMETRAPNLTMLAGPMLGARLLSIAGGLPQLAKFPSSTVQVIGANKALFKHLRERAPSPKHGIIFSHPLINTSPWWQRGKIARALSAKLSLAARMDLYSGEKSPVLLEKLDAKVGQIRALHPNPPAKKPDSGSGKSPGKRSGKGSGKVSDAKGHVQRSGKGHNKGPGIENEKEPEKRPENGNSMKGRGR
ncbi:MAG: NOP5/NOP56 family protein [Methanosarcinaceae archaeon]|nr:NOP5/NOP56 family protein [Methanosarcinaceae archaeon]MDD4498328.1 NOP5/NOP56 family protein [Methanosarcinaceae archaeon]